MKTLFWLFGALIGALFSPVALLLLYAKIGVIPSPVSIASHEALVFYPSASSPLLAPVLYCSVVVGALNAQWFKVTRNPVAGTINLVVSIAIAANCLNGLFDIFLNEGLYISPDQHLFVRVFTYTPLLLGSLSLFALALFNCSVVLPSPRKTFVALCCLGAPSGAILLQLWMWAALILVHPISSTFPWFHEDTFWHPLSSPGYQTSVSQISPAFLLAGACLGLCSTLFCRHEVSSLTRIRGTLCAIGVAAFTLYTLCSFSAHINYERKYFLEGFLYLTPPLIWSLILFFAAIRFKSRLSSMTRTRYPELNFAN